MIRFDCECGKQLQARDENAGKLVLCPACKRQLTVPQAEPTAIQAEEAVELPAAESRVQKQRPIFRDEPEEDAEDRPRRREQAGSSRKAIASLILGILSLFCNVLTGLPALIVGILALRDIGRSRDRLSGRGLAIAGISCACAGSVFSCLLLLPALLLPAVQKVREAAARSQSQNNLKQMVLAMQNYNDTHGQLPAAAICDKAGKPLLSWRVAILPFIGEQNLYAQFKLDEPWDGPNNLRLLSQRPMPNIYNCPDVPTTSGQTIYQVLVGNGAAFDKTRGFKIPQDFPDGMSNTILIVEAGQAVMWTKPSDVDFDPRMFMVPLMNTRSRNVFLVAMADGSTRPVAPQISEKTFKAAITRNGNEILGPDW
jgi:hypothetical protein